VIENHEFLIEASQRGDAWTCGDFNLRGVASGAGLPPNAGTAHANISKWFSEELKTHHFEVVASGPTYVDGGTLDIHFRKDSQHVEARVHWLPRVYSDHALSVAQTNMTVGLSLGETPEHPKDHSKCTIVNWTHTEARWIEAVSGPKDLWEATATLLTDLALNCMSAKVHVEAGQRMADVSALLLHAIALMTVLLCGTFWDHCATYWYHCANLLAAFGQRAESYLFVNMLKPERESTTHGLCMVDSCSGSVRFCTIIVISVQSGTTIIENSFLNIFNVLFRVLSCTGMALGGKVHIKGEQ
jgi:hypothetical protein